MSLSEHLQTARFAKGAIGYNTKEVDAFLAEAVAAAEQDAATLRTLRAKLDAFEGKSAEIARRENEAYRLLAAAKDEAEKLRAAAKARAEAILAEANARAATTEATAATHATDTEREAERQAAETVGNAKQNAAMILAAADKRGRECLAEAERDAAAVRAEAETLARRSAEFEEKLRGLVAETVRALAALNAASPVPIDAAPAASPAPTVSAQAVHAPIATLDAAEAGVAAGTRPRRTDRPRPEQGAPEANRPTSRPADGAQPDTEAHDYAFAGGKLLGRDGAPSAAAPRKLYDTVSVTYEDGDGYDDIRRLMEGVSERRLKDPTDFAN